MIPKLDQLIIQANNILLSLTHLGYEIGCGITQEGKILQPFSSGHNNKIDLPEEYLDLIKSGGLFIHYHPKGFSLSLTDYEMAHYFKLYSIRAIVLNGLKGKGTYYINNPGIYDINKIRALYKTYFSHERMKLDIKCQINAKLIYQREYRKIDRKVWLKIKNKTGLEYCWKGF